MWLAAVTISTMVCVRAPVIARVAVVVGSELPQGVAVDHVVPRIQARVDRYPFGQRSEVAQPAGRGD
jgi:hypothetical protein